VHICVAQNKKFSDVLPLAGKQVCQCLAKWSEQLRGTPTIPPSYIRVCAVAWACGDGETDMHDSR